jgi:GT2 family glycosyltransferase
VSEKKRLVFCLPGASFTEGFFRSFFDTYTHFMEQDEWEVAISQHYSSNVALCRNGIVTQNYGTLEHERPKTFAEYVPFAGVRYDYLVWIDSDQVFGPESVENLLEHEEDIVSGYTPLSATDPRAAIGYFADGLSDDQGELMTQYIGINSVQAAIDSVKEANKTGEPTLGRVHNDLLDVDFAGFAMIAIKKGVFEKITFPWFAQDIRYVNGREILMSEDISFCMKARKAGFRVLVDPRVRIGHQKLASLQ